jgi:hypothetical protein
MSIADHACISGEARCIWERGFAGALAKGRLLFRFFNS